MIAILKLFFFRNDKLNKKYVISIVQEIIRCNWNDFIALFRNWPSNCMHFSINLSQINIYTKLISTTKVVEQQDYGVI